jgi:hypothetical protein
MTFQEKAVEFLDELLVQFLPSTSPSSETSSPSVRTKKVQMYHKTLLIRHRVKNVLENDELEIMVKEYLNPENKEIIHLRDQDRFLKDIELEFDWDVISPENRCIIWDWISHLVDMVLDFE